MPICPTLHSELQGQLYTLQLCNNWHISGVFPSGIPHLPCIILLIIESHITCQLSYWYTGINWGYLYHFLFNICTYWLHMLKACRAEPVTRYV